ncbi:hypothetical protein U2F26_29075 [Micromonospora sp. 4G57]|uniref:MFS transporter n=1 Tax=Micromonospora sicca TaxID=2202420 RepID=A0ABU5JLF8_9ACTN|nr:MULTISPECIES: hypothetical protein [unclassified Micromonospora]MDZ5446730.1 hypothetical protein [Micromonospora sp. 4G57]MDZ5493465.1 hypothetical protein [Micromonospora sp. 4G53]
MLGGSHNLAADRQVTEEPMAATPPTAGSAAGTSHVPASGGTDPRRQAGIGHFGRQVTFAYLVGWMLLALTLLVANLRTTGTAR